MSRKLLEFLTHFVANRLRQRSSDLETMLPLPRVLLLVLLAAASAALAYGAERAKRDVEGSWDLLR